MILTLMMSSMSCFQSSIILQHLMDLFSKTVLLHQFIFCRHLNMKKVDGKIHEKEVGPRFEMKRKLLFPLVTVYILLVLLRTTVCKLLNVYFCTLKL